MKNKIQLYAVYKRYIRFKDTKRVKVKGWNKICHVNSNFERTRVAMQI
jgi:hypothetical protein